MIQIKEKYECCGCGACVQRCPKHCIEFIKDKEGFLYPKVDETTCINCGLCEKVCPVINQNSIRKPLDIYAASNTNEVIKAESSSGGIFTILAETIINEGGVVFGARFNEQYEVVHDFTDNISGLVAFRGSKYVQSKIGNSFSEAETFLKQNRRVLFSGTPCQISGLKKFLRKEYSNLVTVDFVCHGVPSPEVWRKYLSSIIRPNGVDGKNSVSLSLKDMLSIESISFRDKRNGWKKYGFSVRQKSALKADKNTVFPSDNNDTIIYEPFDKNAYLHGFVRNLYLRPSCYHCPSKSFKSGSDYTLADFWGASCYIKDDDKGISILFVHNNKLNIDTSSFIRIDMEAAIGQNPAITKSSNMKDGRDAFFRKMPNNELDIEALIKKYAKYSIKEYTRNLIIKILLKSRLISIAKIILRKK